MRGVVIPAADVRIRASRSSGPGGQHANVTASRITVTVDLRRCGGLTGAQRERALGRLGPVVSAVAQDARSQSRNRELALARLEQKLRDALLVRAPRTATRPTRASKQRRLESKSRRADVKKARRRPPLDG